MVEPKCQYFGVCGGCEYQDRPYEEQLEIKRTLVANSLNLSIPVLPTIASPKPFHYRSTISLSIKKNAGALRYGYVGKDGRTFIPIEACAIADERLNQYIPQAIERLMALPGNKPYRTSQTMLRVGESGEVVTTFRDDRKKTVYCQIKDKKFTYAVSSFFQHNVSILGKLVEAVEAALTGDHKDRMLLDLYCGVGFFSIFLASNYQKVMGIEEGYESVKYAKENAAANGVANAEFVQGKVEELIGNIDAPHFDVVVDPPRAGLKPEVIQALCQTRPQNLVYVSCSLESLKRDLDLLSSTFKVISIQPIDLFPQTKHIETIALLQIK